MQTATLGPDVQYIAVSHTWGRWKHHDRPYVKIKGVDWAIPQNSRFRVEDLPDILSHLPGNSAFIWFDLVYIPQDGSAVAVAKIARQATIFGCATNSIAWFSNVDNFESLQKLANLLCWLQLDYPTQSVSEANIQQLYVDAVEHLAHNGTNLLEPDGLSSIPNSSFSSLWTLQEACLRPDMWLCDSYWRPLTMGSNTPLALDELLALVDQYYYHIYKIRDQIGASHVMLEELGAWHGATALTEILNSTNPCHVMMLGNRRTCSDYQRAAAIMSVIDVRDWYSESAILDLKDEDLVLGQYPIAFVQEMREKIGARFFGTRLPQYDYHMIPTAPSSKPRETMYKDPRGSLLPFSMFAPRHDIQTFQQESIQAFAGSDWDDHPSVSTWVIRTDGSVYVPEAVRFTRGRPVSCLFEGSSLSLNPEIGAVHYSAFSDLGEWLEECPITRSALLISFHVDRSVRSSFVAITGIILEELAPSTFIYNGFFHAMSTTILESPQLESERLEWKVM